MGFLGPRMYSPVACRTLDKPEWLRNSEVKRAGAGQDETGQGGSWSTAGWVLQYLGEQTEKAPQERQTKASHSHSPQPGPRLDTKLTTRLPSLSLP